MPDPISPDDRMVARLDAVTTDVKTHRAARLVGEKAPVRPETTAMVAWVLLLATLAVREVVALYTRALGDTLSETIWWLLGTPYRWRWVLLGGVISALCTWMMLHFLWRHLWPQLATASALLWILIGWLLLLTVVALVRP